MSVKNVLWGLMFAVLVITGWEVGGGAPVKDEDAELYRLFVDALENIDRNYVKPVDRRKLIEAAIDGMLSDLDDYSDFITVKEKKGFDRQTTGKFGGIGIQIGPKEKDVDYLLVISPLAGTPAYEAGIIAGDRIYKVDGTPVKGLSQSDVVDKLQGDPGTPVKISVLHRPYQGEPEEISLKRATINTESVLGDHHTKDDQWDYFIDPANKIAYVRITNFAESTAQDLEKVLRQLVKDGMKGLILDLRYNPGGLLSSAVEIADLFVNEGVIVSTTGRNIEQNVKVAKRDGTLPDFPMAVLVNRFSASASEVVSACLQDHHRAVIIGERTFGKASVQNVIEMENGQSALKLTTGGYTRPNGANIQRPKEAKESDNWGVKPDAGFDIPFPPNDHQAYFVWRRQRDQIEGKSNIVAKVREQSKQAEAKKDEKPAEKKAADKKADESDPDAKVAPYDDKQLAKAIEFIKGKQKVTASAQ